LRRGPTSSHPLSFPPSAQGLFDIFSYTVSIDAISRWKVQVSKEHVNTM
jgi:hypothetical protein